MPESPAQLHEARISDCECEAMRSLDDDPSYTRAEIAFMFECQRPTVTQHADGDCCHGGRQ